MLEQTTQPVHVPPGAGDTVFLLGDTYTTLLSGAQTGGTFALLEALVPAHTGPPPHIHHAEDETFTAASLQQRRRQARANAVHVLPARDGRNARGDRRARTPRDASATIVCKRVEALTRVAAKYRFSIVAD